MHQFVTLQTPGQVSLKPGTSWGLRAQKGNKNVDKLILAVNNVGRTHG